MPNPMPLVDPVTRDTFPASDCPVRVFGCFTAIFMTRQTPFWSLLLPMSMGKRPARLGAILPERHRGLKMPIG
jgi:hypothetical protein